VVAKLLDKVTITKNKNVLYQLLLVLNLCNYHVRKDDKTIVEKRLQKEIQDIIWIYSALDDVQSLKCGSFIESALINELEQSKKIILFLLSFIYESKAIMQARDNLFHPSISGKRAYALEMIDNTIPMEFKTVILPLLEDVPDKKKLVNLFRIYSLKRMPLNFRLEDIFKHSVKWKNTWLESCVLFTMAELSVNESIGAVISSLSHKDPFVRETAAWTLAKLDSHEFQNHSKRLKEDTDQRISYMPYYFENNLIDEVMLTVNKVNFLKNTEIFTDTTESFLVGVACQLGELCVKGGDLLVKQDEENNKMFFIQKEFVNAYHNKHAIEGLGPHDVFGLLT